MARIGGLKVVGNQLRANLMKRLGGLGSSKAPTQL